VFGVILIPSSYASTSTLLKLVAALTNKANPPPTKTIAESEICVGKRLQKPLIFAPILQSDEKHLLFTCLWGNALDALPKFTNAMAPISLYLRITKKIKK